MSSSEYLNKAIEAVKESRNRYLIMLRFCNWRSSVSEFVSAKEDHRNDAKYAIWGEHAFFQELTHEEAFQMETEYLRQGEEYEKVYTAALEKLDEIERELTDLFLKTSECKNS